MKKSIFIVSFAVFCLVLILAGCQTQQTSKMDVKTNIFISKKDLQKQKSLPLDVIYDKEHQKVGVIFRSTQNKKQLKLYDTASEPFSSYFETAFADDVFEPKFASEYGVLYALFNRTSWQVFLKKPLLQPKLINTFEVLTSLALNNATIEGFASGRGKDGKWSVSSVSDIGDVSVIDNLMLLREGGLAFRALKKNSEFVVNYRGKESELYGYVSRLSFSDDEKLVYIARDMKDKWFVVVGDKKTKLDKQYKEIGAILIKNDHVVFSGIEKDTGKWGIYDFNKVSVKNLLYPPQFVVMSNGKVAYTTDEKDGVQYVYKGEKSTVYNQIDQLIEDGNGNLFAKVKEKTGLWVVVSGENVSPKYLWTSRMFLGKDGNIFFFGINPNGDFEYAKFQVKLNQ